MPARRPPAAAPDGSGRRAARRGEGGGGAAPPHHLTTPRDVKHRTRPTTTRPQNRAGDAGPGPVRDPPPTRWGEARAAVGRRASLGGPRHTERRSPLTKETGQTDTRRRGAAAGGYGTPRHPLRIAREGFLTEGGIAPDPGHSPRRARPRALGRGRLGVGACGTGRGRRTTASANRGLRREHSAHNDTRAEDAVVHE